MIDQLNQIIPRGLPGVVHCHIEANPEIQFVTWTKDSRLYDPFEVPGIMAMENGSILIDMVSTHLHRIASRWPQDFVGLAFVYICLLAPQVTISQLLTNSPQNLRPTGRNRV